MRCVESMMTHSVIFKRFAISLATLGFTAHIILDAATVVSGVGVLFETRTGARNHGGRLSRYEVNSSKHCAVRCVQHRECNSYNLGPVPMSGGGGGGGNSRSCELVKTDHNSVAAITEAAGWTFAIGTNHIHTHWPSTNALTKHSSVFTAVRLCNPAFISYSLLK